MAAKRHERPALKNDWSLRGFPQLMGSQFDNWPALTGLGYPDLNVLDDLDGLGDVEGMRIEEYRDDSSLVIKVEVPGVDPDHDIEIMLLNGNLDIHVQRHEEHDTADENGYYRSEFTYGSFARRIAVPAGTTSQDVLASYRDGILEIRVPVLNDQMSERVPVSRV